MNKNKKGFAILFVIVGIPALLLLSSKILHRMSLMIDTSLQRQNFYTDIYKADLLIKKAIPFFKKNFYMLKQKIKEKNGTSVYESNIFNNYENKENLDNFFIILKTNESTDKNNAILIEIAKKEKKKTDSHKLLRFLFKMDEINNRCVVSHYTIINTL